MVISRTSPLWVCTLILLFNVLSSCNALETFPRREIFIESQGFRFTIDAEIARTQAQQQQGLMYRRELDDGKGMLFVYERDQMMSFWMRNTLVPLSIAFISQDGRILEIYDMEPESLELVRSSRSARYALEVPQGWFERVGISIGDYLIIDDF